ncbi:MAG: SDR family oxidoreductase [Eubacterium sp.]|nr:SDR family oxidoreductase [Eubacterium sp.]
MIALITGASSGIGKELAKNMASRGVHLILVARRTERLLKLKQEIQFNCPNVRVKTITADLSRESQCIELYEKTKGYNIDFLFNNAGFGLYGDFLHTELVDELNMINVNIKAVHILTKLFLADFSKRNFGYIMNTASVAGFMAGPLLATYYATKNYVLQLTKAIYEELRSVGSNVVISALCPGPVNTEFNEVAGVKKFGMPTVSDAFVADYAIERLLYGDLVIIPGVTTKAAVAGSRFAPTKLLLKTVRTIQEQKKPAE